MASVHMKTDFVSGNCFPNSVPFGQNLRGPHAITPGQTRTEGQSHTRRTFGGT